MRVLVAGFQAGEFSPLLEGRTDLAQAASGCRLMRNAIPRALGGAFQRPGFLLAGVQRDQARRTRLLPFSFSSSVTYRIELGHYFARFWLGNQLCIHQAGLTGAQYLSTPGQPLTLATPWSSDEAFKVQFAQANDVIWLAHGNYWSRRLIRYGEQDWRIDELPVTVPPLRDPNVSEISLTASAVAGNITLTATGGSPFTAQDVGGYYQVSHRRDLPFSDITIADGTLYSTPIRVTGKWEVFTYGKWTGALYLEQERIAGGGVWETIRTWKSKDGDFNAQSVGEADGDTQLRLKAVISAHTNTTNPRAQLSAVDATVNGLVRITGYTSGTVVTGTVTRAIFSTAATKIWAEGAWSARRGYPRAITLHGQRLLFAGTLSQPQSVWGSAVNAFDNFERTTLADAGFTYQIAAQQSNAILWVTSQKGLLIGTEGDEWILDGGTQGESITASNVRAERRSGHGSSDIQAIMIGSAVIFVQNGGTVLNEYLFDQNQQGYEAIELTELAEHLGDERFVQFAYAQNPHSIIWAVTEAGSLLSLTYKRRNQTLAWAKHTTPDGFFESVTTTPGPLGVHEVWVTVRRTVAGLTVRTVERMDPYFWSKVKSGDTRQLCVGDSAVMAEQTASMTFGGLGHLNGALVNVLADGAIHPPRRVANGSITLERLSTAVVAGLAPLVEIQPMPVEFQLDTGAAFGRRFRVPDIDLKLWKTGGSPTYADDLTGKIFDVPMRSANDTPGVPVPLFTGIRKLPMPARHGATTGVVLRNNTMLPLNILSMVMQVEIHGD